MVPSDAAPLAADLDMAVAEVASASPALGFVSLLRKRLAKAARAVGLWIAKNLNLATEEFSKAFGRTLGMTAAGALSLTAILTVFGQMREAVAGLDHIVMLFISH